MSFGSPFLTDFALPCRLLDDEFRIELLHVFAVWIPINKKSVDQLSASLQDLPTECANVNVKQANLVLVRLACSAERIDSLDRDGTGQRLPTFARPESRASSIDLLIAFLSPLPET